MPKDPQKISGKLLDQILGKDTYPGGKGGRQIQKMTAFKKGRKDPGMSNPRGQPTGRSHEEQLFAPLGEHPDVGVVEALMATMGEEPTEVVAPQSHTDGVTNHWRAEPPVEAGVTRPAYEQEVEETDAAGRGANLAKTRSAIPPDDEFNSPNYAGTTQDLTPAQAATATRLFIDRYGHEPGTDGEIVEAEQLYLDEMSATKNPGVSEPSTEEDILNTVLGMKRK